MDRSPLHTLLPRVFLLREVFNPEIYTEIELYPQLSTSFPHLGVKVSKRTSLKESLMMTGRELVAALLLNLGGDLIYMVIESSTFSHQLADLPICVHHSGVVSAAKGLADLR